MDRVIVTCVYDPFNAFYSRETVFADPGKPIREYVTEFVKEEVRDGYDLAVAINGSLQEDMDLVMQPGDSMAFCFVPAGGGGGKNIARIVATLALVALTIYTYGATSEFLGEYLGSELLGNVAAGVLASGVGMAGMAAINALLPYQVPEQTALGSGTNYGWDEGPNQFLQGGALPVLYGTRRITPPILSRYIDTTQGANKQYLNALYALCEGIITDIPLQASLLAAVTINRTPADQFTQGNVVCSLRTGKNALIDQQVVQGFESTRTDTAVGVKLTDEVNWITRRTSGNAVENIGFCLVAPAGLGAAGGGGISQVTVGVDMEYRIVGGGSWTRVQGYTSGYLTVGTAHWSGGYWFSYDPNNPVWFELVNAGGSGHYEHEPYVPTIAPDYNLGWVYEYHWLTVGEGGGSYWVIGGIAQDHTDMVGQQTAAIRKGWAFPVPVGQYDIRMKLHAAYQTSGLTMADVYWESFAEAIPDKFVYPNTALLGVHALATDQLSGGMPTVSILIDRGSITLPYFGSKPSSNPAWACVDLLTNDRYGGGVDIAKIDTAAFQTWADFCTTNSYTVNLYLDTAASMRTALNMISSLGRGVVVQIGSKFTVITDKQESTPTQSFLFTVGNIVSDSFREEWLPFSDRANCVEVEYYDANLNYERTVLTVYAADFDTTSEPVKSANIALYGCTDRAMAAKHAKFFLNCNRYIAITASWDCDVDALACFPGDLVQVQHDLPQWAEGGRAVAGSSNTVTVDRDIQTGGTLYVRVKHAADDTVEEKLVSSITNRVVTISGSFTSNPVADDLYSIGNQNLVTKYFRVVRITRAADLRRKIVAVEYNANIYSDSVTVPAPDPWPTPSLISDLRAAEVYKEGSVAGVSLTWRGYATPCAVFVKRSTESAYRYLGSTNGTSFETYGYDAGVQYTFLVSPTSDPDSAGSATVTITIGGNTTLPVIATPVFEDAKCVFSDMVSLFWLPIADTRFANFELRTDLNWGNATNRIYVGAATSFVWNAYAVNPTTTSYTFYLKSQDSFLTYSTSYDTLALSLTAPGAPSSVSASPSYGKILVSWAAMINPVVVGCEVWRASTNNRASSAFMGQINGTTFVDTNSIVAGTTYYYWLRFKTMYGTYSAWSVGDTSGTNGGSTPSINTGDLADYAISQMKLAASIVPPEVVTSLPSLPDANYPNGKIVYLTTDGKLYRNKQLGVGASDNFNRGSLGSNWTQQPGDSGTMVLQASTYVESTTGTDSLMQYNAVTFGANHSSQCSVSNLASFADDAGPCVRLGASASTGYVLACKNNYIKLCRLDTGMSWAELTGITTTVADGDTLKLEVIGSDLIGYHNGTAVIWWTDGTYTTGQPGLYSGDPTCHLDNWGGYDVGYFSGWQAVVNMDDMDRLIEGADINTGTIAAVHLVLHDGSNFVQNPVFAQGSSNSWNLNGGATYIRSKSDTGVPTGCPQDYCAEIGGSVTGGVSQTQYIDLVPGEQYYAAAWAANDGGTNTGCQIYLLWQKTDLSWGGTSFFAFVDNNTTWTFGEGVMTVPAGVYKGSLVVQRETGAGAKWYVTSVRFRKAAGASLIVDGAINAKMMTTDKLTVGACEAGAIGADEIAANTIVAKHMVIGNFGSINIDPECKDSSAWEWTYRTGSNVQITDGVAGNWVLRSNSGQACYVNDLKYYAIDPGKNYRLSFRARASSASCGTMYGTLRQYQKDDGTTCATNGGRYPYKPCSGQAAHTIWVYYSAIFAPADFQANCRYVRPDFLLNYTDATGYWEIQDVRLVEAVATDLIVDGTITADKVGTNEIIAQTANLKDAVVSTLKIGANAVTVPVGAYTDGWNAIAARGYGGGDYGDSYQNVQITVPASTPTQIIGTFKHRYCGATDIIGATLIKITNGSSSYLSGYYENYGAARGTISLGFLDIPSSGTTTYHMLLYTTAATATGVQVGALSMFAVGAKR